MDEKLVQCGYKEIEPRIISIRGKKVILDFDLAKIYGVTTKVLNQAVKRNREKFPPDFMFKIETEGIDAWHLSRSQFIALNPQRNRSLIVTGSQKHRDPRFIPYAFTEHGAIMAAMVLNSPKAVQMSVLVVRAFVRMRETLAATETMARKLAEIEKTLLSHNAALRDLYQKIRPLLLPPPEKPRRQIGFGARERRAQYKIRSKRSL